VREWRDRRDPDVSRLAPWLGVTGARTLTRLNRSLVSPDRRPNAWRRCLHVVQLLVLGFMRSQLTRMAAALSYRTIFALIPILLVGLVGLAAFSTPETQSEVLRQILHYAGLDRIAIPAVVPEGGGALGGVTDGSGVAATITPEEQARLDAARAAISVDGWIEDQITRVRGVSFATLGIIGVLFLIYAAVSMVVEIETSFNQIYNAPEGRSWVKRVLQYWTLLTLGPMLLIVSFSMTARATSYATDLAANVKIPIVLGERAPVDDEAGVEGEGAAPGEAGAGTVARGASEEEVVSETTQAVRYWTPRIVAFVGTTAISTLLFMVIYVSVPNTRVQLMPALWGAATAALIWEAGKWGFAEYVRHATDPSRGGSYAQFYGAVAILPLGMLWIYFTWVIVLTGLQLAYSMQTYTQATARGLTDSVLATLGLIDEPRRAGRLRLVDPSAMLGVAACVAERFQAGKTSDHSEVARATGIDEQAVGEMLEKMAESGVVHRVVTGDALNMYSPARPLEQISASELLRLGDELQAETGGMLRGSVVAETLTRARTEALAGKTLADLVAKPVVVVVAAASIEPATPINPVTSGMPTIQTPPMKPAAG
jgi:membrane protein